MALPMYLYVILLPFILTPGGSRQNSVVFGKNTGICRSCRYIRDRRTRDTPLLEHGYDLCHVLFVYYFLRFR